MSEKMDTARAAATLNLSTREYIRLIFDNLIKTRPEKDVVYRPYLPQPWAYAWPALSFDEIDLGRVYKDAPEGAFAYLRCGLTAQHAQDIVVSTAGNIELFLRGERIYKGACEGAPDPKKYESTPVHLKAGVTELTVKCEKRGESFKFFMLTAMPVYPVMKARDYLFHTRVIIPRGEYAGEDGYEISRLYAPGETPEAIEYAFPKPSPAESALDFSWANEGDDFGCAVSFAKKDGSLRVAGARAFVNGAPIEAENGQIALRSGDRVTLLVENCRETRARFESDCLGIPFLETRRENGTKWLLMALPEFPRGIEAYADFKKPLECGGRRFFWRFADGSYLRAYLDTSFFGQWFYALMVGNYGLLKYSRALGCREAGDYFIRNMKTIAEYYDYAQYDAALFGTPTFLQRSVKLNNLDSIGTVGMNLIEYYNLSKDSKALALIQTLARAIMQNIPRFEDGAFMRGDTMWADDTFMSCPFLARLGRLTGDERYFAECKTQIEGFHKRLFMQGKGVYSHIYFVEPGQASRVPWGRGNGWVLLSLCEILENLPEGHPDRPYYIARYRELIEGVRALQRENGMWGQVLDRPEAYDETSCTAMFTYAVCLGVRKGLLPEAPYREIARKGVRALLTNAVDASGNVYGVCRGSSRSMDYRYYLKLGTAFNDDHGTGIILCALIEFMGAEEARA